jgi:hypothetical protein
MRPLFLRNITRSPSLRWFLHKLISRIARQLRGIERPVVGHMTDAELRAIELMMAFTAGVCAVGIPTIVYLMFSLMGATC